MLNDQEYLMNNLRKMINHIQSETEKKVKKIRKEAEDESSLGGFVSRKVAND